MKKVLCCIPTLGSIRAELAQLLYLWKQKYGDFFDVYTSFSRPLFSARNDCVRTFLKSDASYLFFVDSDAVPPVNAIELLLSHGFKKKIVSGLCHEIKRDSDGVLKIIPLILKQVGDSEYEIDSSMQNGVVEVDATGTICVIVHRSVFESLSEPWFYNHAEDFYFYKKAKARGYQVYVDCDCRILHYVEVGI